MSNPHFDDMLAADAALFKDSANMPGVESVTFNAFGGSASAISANVMRNTPVEENGVMSRRLHVFVWKTDVPSVDTGGDTITIAHRYGETPREHIIAAIVQEDAGGFLLELE